MADLVEEPRAVGTIYLPRCYPRPIFRVVAKIILPEEVNWAEQEAAHREGRTCVGRGHLGEWSLEFHMWACHLQGLSVSTLCSTQMHIEWRDDYWQHAGKGLITRTRSFEPIDRWFTAVSFTGIGALTISAPET